MSFHLCDIYLPGRIEFTESMNPETEILGRIVDFSDSGNNSATFAIVQTDRQRRVIVPVANLSLIRKE